jgi:hypothetical protein
MQYLIAVAPAHGLFRPASQTLHILLSVLVAVVVEHDQQMETQLWVRVVVELVELSLRILLQPVAEQQLL